MKHDVVFRHKFRICRKKLAQENVFFVARDVTTTVVFHCRDRPLEHTTTNFRRTSERGSFRF